MYLGPHAPHYPAQPAPWYEHTFDDVSAPDTPNFNVESADKAQHVRQNPPLTEVAKCWVNQHFRDRWASLLSVDDIIGAVVGKLKQQGKLEQTYIIYASDHGYNQGQWRLGTSKQHPYEQDIRIPLFIRGPGVVAGRSFDYLTANIDIFPTVLDLAGVVVPTRVDGRSMMPWLVSRDFFVRPVVQLPWRDQLLIEYLAVGTYWNDHSVIWNDGTTAEKCGGERPRGPSGMPQTCTEESGVGNGTCWYVDSEHSNNWRALRILNSEEDLQYIEYDPNWHFDGEGATGAGMQHYELYDLSKDPYQMENTYPNTDLAKRTLLHTALAKYWKCSGDDTTPLSLIHI